MIGGEPGRRPGVSERSTSPPGCSRRPQTGWSLPTTQRLARASGSENQGGTDPPEEESSAGLCNTISHGTPAASSAANQSAAVLERKAVSSSAARLAAF